MLYIPPTQNPFLAQSLGMLGNMMSQYMAHGYRSQELQQAQEASAKEKQQDLNVKMALGGYRPVSAVDQMADVGNGPPPENQLTLPGYGNQPGTTWTEPKSKKPEVMNLDIGGGRTLPVVYEPGTKKFTIVTEALKQPSDKMPAATIQEFSVWKSEPGNGGKSIMDFIANKAKVQQHGAAVAGPKDPNLKESHKIELINGKSIRQDYVYNPKTGKKEKDGEPYEVPKTMGLWDMLNPGGASGQGSPDARLNDLNNQIQQLQQALSSQE